MTRDTVEKKKKKKEAAKPKSGEENKNSVELKNARPQNGLFHHVESERSRDLYISPLRAYEGEEEKTKRPIPPSRKKVFPSLWIWKRALSRVMNDEGGIIS